MTNSIETKMDNQKPKRPKRLTDIVLEQAVYNFAYIFLDIDSKLDKLSVKKDMNLPCYIFERIINKSMEMKWIIPVHHLKVCLSARDVLQWKNIDLTYCCHGYIDRALITECDFKNITASSAIIRSLSMIASKLPPQALEYLSKMKGLENLTINFQPDLYKESDWHNTTWTPKKIKLEKLRTLKINCCHAVSIDFLKHLDLVDSEDSLEVLVIENFSMNYKTPILLSINSFRNLKYLHLRYLNHPTDQWEIIFKDIKKLQHLKTLDLSGSIISIECGDLLRDVFDNVTSIENLEVSNTVFAGRRDRRDRRDLSLCGRKLKYFGNHSLKYHSYGHLKYDDIYSLLLFLEDSLDRSEVCDRIVDAISHGILKHNWVADSDVFQRLERTLPNIYYKTVLGCRGVESILPVLKNNAELNRELLMKLSLTLLSGFLCQLRLKSGPFPFILNQSEFFLPQFLAHIEKGTNTYIAKSIMKVILTLFDDCLRGYRCRDKLIELGAVNVFKKICEENKFNEEANSILNKLQNH